ncbi:hypothetical protein [Leptolyngbya sp. 7M]|uniref:hypothetical protein n=1 Tax=Leptolyngbya sp. 7M TaxID=2812896 RepID=UPI001B8B1604|nr:hypothetical protein [Leptolyngbya sp. 7M]QYO64759.1 hypothetical protein JVX88_35075 [Leptolyngbya sp. 7M]
MTNFNFESSTTDNSFDPILQQQIWQLYRHILHSRWVFIACLWLIIAPLSLWSLRHEVSLWLDYFTWTAVRYSLIYNPLATIGLTLCVALTLTTLPWQSHNILFGISPHYLRRLERQVLKIRQQGKSHPLWKRVCGNISEAEHCSINLPD